MDGLSSLLSNLSTEDIEMLKSAAASLMGGESPSVPTEEPTSARGHPDLPFKAEDMAMFSKLGGLLGASGGKEDYRTQFLNALKPLLSEPRQKRADEAIRILRLIDMLPLLKESGMFSGLL